MLIRLVAFALFVLLLAYGFSWLADRPGDLSLIWEGQIYQTKLIVAASAIIALIAAVMIAVGIRKRMPPIITRRISTSMTAGSGLA